MNIFAYVYLFVSLSIVCVWTIGLVKKFVWVFPKNVMEKTWKNFLANQVFMFCSFHFNLYNKLRRANQYICSIEPSYSREKKIHFLMSIFMSFKSKVLKFFSCKSLILLVKFTPNYFIFFVTLQNIEDRWILHVNFIFRYLAELFCCFILSLNSECFPGIPSCHLKIEIV